MNLSNPSTRWAIFAMVVVALAIAGFGAYASQQPAAGCPGPPGQGPGATLPQYICEQTGLGRNEALLSADHAAWFYGATGAVLVLGLFGIWAASARS